MIAFNVIHAEITWNLSDNGTLTISGTGGIVNYWSHMRDKIRKVIIEHGVTGIGGETFYGCSNLISITIPNSVTWIGERAFEGCSSLTSINIPNSVTYIGEYVFYKCKGLTSIAIPESVTSIGCRTFSGCISLTSVTIPNSITNIGEYAFENCCFLKSVTIPNSVRSIESGVFYGCQNLISIIIPNSVTCIGDNTFGHCSKLTSVTIPSSVTSIGDCAFEACAGLTSITIPESVTSIGDGAFRYCSGLTSVTIPEFVTSIGVSAFYCRCLTSITCEATIPPYCGSGCFTFVNLFIPIYVPESSINAYKNQSEWMYFQNILPIPEIPTHTLNLTDITSGLIKGNYQKKEVTYTRNNLSIGDYATFCLPFDIHLSKTTDSFSKVYVPLNIGLLKPSGVLLMFLEEMNNNTIIKAGQTFVAKCKTTDVIFENCSDITFDYSTPNPPSSNVKIYNFDGISGVLTQNTDVKIKIGGTYSQLSNIDKEKYRALFTNGSFNSTTSVTPFQMYVYIDDSSLGSKITSISFDFNDEATGIKELRMNNDNSPIYDLNGRMVNEKNLKPGLYIKKGKKVVVK